MTDDGQIRADIITKIKQANKGNKLYISHRALQKACHKETFKLLFEFFGKDNRRLLNIQEQAKDIGTSFAKRKLQKGFRATKGFMEDVIAFMVLDQNPNFESAIDDRTNTYRDYVFDNYDKFFSGDSSYGDLEKMLKDSYSFMAKVDHMTSLKLYMAEIEDNEAYLGFEKLCVGIAPTLLLILIQYGFYKTEKYGDKTSFVCRLWIASMYISGIVAIYELSKSKNTVDKAKYFKSEADKRYEQEQKQIMEESRAAMSGSELNDPKKMTKILNDVQSELIRRGYLQPIT